MPKDGAHYIVTVSGGTVVDKQSNGVVDRNAAEETATQHWTIEHGDSPNVVAFQNASTGQWLRAFTGAAYGKVDCGEKQWWTLEKGPSPGSCWIKCNDYQDAYLCNANGSYVDKNQVYTWPKQLNWTHALTWHLKDANAPGFPPTQSTSSWMSSWSSEGNGLLGGSPFSSGNGMFSSHSYSNSNNGGGLFSSSTFESTSTADLQKKIKMLEAKESSFSRSEDKMKEIEGREAMLIEKERRIEELEKREAEIQRREQELAAKEAAQKKEAEQLEASQKELASSSSPSDTRDFSPEQQSLQKKLDELREAEREFAAKEASSAKREETFMAKEKEIKAKEADLEQKLREVGAGEAVAVRLENDNLKLRLMLKEMERGLEAARHQGGTDKDSKEDDTRLERVKNENQRLKNLIAQHFLNAQNKESGAKGPKANGGPSAQDPRPQTTKTPSSVASKANKQPAPVNTPAQSASKADSQSTSREQPRPASDKLSANMSRPVSKAPKPKGTTSSSLETPASTKSQDGIGKSNTQVKNQQDGDDNTPKSPNPTKVSAKFSKKPQPKPTMPPRSSRSSAKAPGRNVQTRDGNDTNSKSSIAKQNIFQDVNEQKARRAGDSTAQPLRRRPSSTPKGPAAADKPGRGPKLQKVQGEDETAGSASAQGRDALKGSDSASSAKKGVPRTKEEARPAFAEGGKTPLGREASEGPRTGKVTSQGEGRSSQQKPDGPQSTAVQDDSSSSSKTRKKPVPPRVVSKPAPADVVSGKVPSAIQYQQGQRHDHNTQDQDSDDHATHIHTRHGHQHPSLTKPDSGSSAKKELSKTFQHTSATSDWGDDCAVHYSCGHVLYPTPRKLNRKVLGIMYE